MFTNYRKFRWCVSCRRYWFKVMLFVFLSFVSGFFLYRLSGRGELRMVQSWVIGQLLLGDLGLKLYQVECWWDFGELGLIIYLLFTVRVGYFGFLLVVLIRRFSSRVVFIKFSLELAVSVTQKTRKEEKFFLFQKVQEVKIERELVVLKREQQKLRWVRSWVERVRLVSKA